MDTLVTDTHDIEDLEQVIVLLDRASREIWRLADKDGPSSPLHWLGIGVFLAQGKAVDLLPRGHVIADLDHVNGRLDQAPSQVLVREHDDAAGDDPLQLLRAAEELTRSESSHRPMMPGLSRLVVDLCDLIREASGGR